ncbi:MAG: hypothetical protein R3C99_16220 [Pirellulaceae bacterium]
MPPDRRREVFNELEAIVSRYPYNYFIVTTRPEAVPDDWLRKLNFREAEVAPMVPDIKRFIETWHNAVAAGDARQSRPADELASMAAAWPGSHRRRSGVVSVGLQSIVVRHDPQASAARLGNDYPKVSGRLSNRSAICCCTSANGKAG